MKPGSPPSGPLCRCPLPQPGHRAPCRQWQPRGAADAGRPRAACCLAWACRAVRPGAGPGRGRRIAPGHRRGRGGGRSRGRRRRAGCVDQQRRERQRPGSTAPAATSAPPQRRCPAWRSPVQAASSRDLQQIMLNQGRGDGYTVFVVHGSGWPPGQRITVRLAGQGLARHAERRFGRDVQLRDQPGARILPRQDTAGHLHGRADRVGRPRRPRSRSQVDRVVPGRVTRLITAGGSTTGPPAVSTMPDRSGAPGRRR